MRTVIETPAYLLAADDCGLSEDQRDAIKTVLAREPQMGDPLVGTGGCRKFRFAGRGKGKSGGYRVVHYYGGADVPVFLITVFGKDEKDNLSRAERNELKKMSRQLVESLSKKVTPLRKVK